MRPRQSFPSDLAGDDRAQRLSALATIDHMLRDQIAAISLIQREVSFAHKLLSERCRAPDSDSVDTYLSVAPETRKRQRRANAAEPAAGSPEIDDERKTATGRKGQPVLSAKRRRAALEAIIAGS